MTPSVSGTFTGTFRPFDIGAGIFALVGLALCGLATGEKLEPPLRYGLLSVGAIVILSTLLFWCWQRAKLPQEDKSQFQAALPGGASVNYSAPPKDVLAVARTITRELGFRGETPTPDGELVRIQGERVAEIRPYTASQYVEAKAQVAQELDAHDRNRYDQFRSLGETIGPENQPASIPSGKQESKGSST